MSKVRCNGSTTCLYFLILDRVTYNDSKNNSNFLKDGKVTRTASWRTFMSDFHQLLKDEELLEMCIQWAELREASRVPARVPAHPL